MQKEMKMTRTVVKTKMPAKAKAGQLLRSHIEYDSDGDGATVTHDHQPDPGKNGDPWMKKSFSSRMEAHHHMAEMAGVNATMDEQAEAARAHGKGDSSAGTAGPQEGEGDEDEDPAESHGADPDPGAQATITKAKKPARNA